MSEWTPGPWDIESVSEGVFVVAGLGTPDDWNVAICERASWAPERDNAEANARLIAAAPEMAEALQRVVSLMLRHYAEHDHSDRPDPLHDYYDTLAPLLDRIAGKVDA